MPGIHVYVDGLNLYHDLLRRLDGRGKWLDLEALADKVAGHRAEAVYCFTSRVAGLRPGDVGPRDRQKVFLRAVEAMERVEVVYGSCGSSGFGGSLFDHSSGSGAHPRF